MEVQYAVNVTVTTRHKGTVILPKGFDTNDLMDAIEAELADERTIQFNTDEFEINVPDILRMTKSEE